MDRTNDLTARPHNASEPRLSYPGATLDSDRAKKPPFAEPLAADQELNLGDGVEGLGDFRRAG